MFRNTHLAAFCLLLFLLFRITLHSHHTIPSTSVLPQNQSFVPNVTEFSRDLSTTITAILPVLPETIEQIPDLLKPFLNPPDAIQFPGKCNQSKITHLIVLSPESSLAFVRRELQATFILLRPALDLDLDISLYPWSLQIPIDESDEISLDIDVALLRAVSQLDLAEETMILLMDPTGLSSLSSLSVLSFLYPIQNSLGQTALPLGPYGAKAESYPPISSTSEWGFPLDLQPAKYLYPPFIISASVVASFCDHLLLLETEEQTGDVNGVFADVWPLFGSFVSSFRNDSIGGLKIQPASPTDLQESSSSSENDFSILLSKTRPPVDFLFILPTLADLHCLSSLICLLLANNTTPNLLIIVYTTQSASNSFDIHIEPEDVVWESLVFENEQGCRILYEHLTCSSYSAFSSWFLQRLSPSSPIHILFTVKQFTFFLPFILSENPDIFNSTTHISIPRADLGYTDWISSLTIAELRSKTFPLSNSSV